jgi:sigma-B regulation protein RsbU (phosphoserine phosphatase)
MPGKLRLLAGVFLLSAPAALLHDLALRGHAGWSQVAAWTLATGTLAATSLLASHRPRSPFILVPVLVLVLAVLLAGWEFWMPRPASTRAYLDYLLCGVMLGAGYTLIVRLISDEGVRGIRQRTEIALAQEVHDALVPPVSWADGGLEIHGDSQPATELGGDLVDVVRAGGRIGIYVADVAGHGVPAAVTMSMVKSAVRMRLRGRPPLADLVRDLNEVLHDVGKPGSFVTFAGLEFTGPQRFEYSLAGHPPLLIFRAATGEVEHRDAEGPPLGVVPGFAFAAHPVDLAAGDLVAVLTDGLTEVRSAQGEEFGEERMAEALRANAGRPLPEIHAAILGVVRRFGPQVDDQTLLLIRARA